jgi:Fic family protein
VPKIPGERKLVPQGYHVFIPDPLPPPLTLPPSIAHRIEDATHLLGKVEMCRTLLPNADLLIYSSLQREALASSTIEGTLASADELIRYQITQRSEGEAAREVNNYSQALSWGCEQLEKRPLAVGLILGLHERLMHGVRGGGAAGRLKDRQNRIGSDPTEPIEASVFIPPPPQDTPQLLAALERYINSENNEEPRVVQCALTHFQFETIHPFNDGNGRVGRLLIILQMMQLRLLSAPLIYPSVYFERSRAQYYQHLQDVRDKGAWHDWIEFFARGIVEQCEETIKFTRTILELKAGIESKENVRKRASLGAVVRAFFDYPLLSATDVSRNANMSYNSAQAALEELEREGIVREFTGKKKGRVYACEPVLKAIFGSDHKSI